uniref:Uncharacterized protein n=1 Tax=Arundo donax TaxID=35708 RepID=A0A0A9HAI2_ARUDO
MLCIILSVCADYRLLHLGNFGVEPPIIHFISVSTNS